MATTDPTTQEEKLKQRYLKISKIFLLITLIFSLWIVVVIIGFYNLEFAPKWAALTIEQWILSAIVLISILICFEIIFILHYLSSKRKKVKPEPTRHPEYLQGKQVHNFTIPVGAKGGIFSKTYILIDENRVLHLRYQMIPPNDLWRKQQ
jgi:hypothetical protein